MYLWFQNELQSHQHSIALFIELGHSKWNIGNKYVKQMFY